MANKVKVMITFDKDPKRIGKTIEVTAEEARALVSESRATPVGTGKDADALRTPPGPTVKPPLPKVAGTAADVVVAQDAGRLSDAANASEAKGSGKS